MSEETAEIGEGREEELLLLALDLLEQGRTDEVERLLGENPEHAERLRLRLRALDQAGLLAVVSKQDDRFPERLGEFVLKRRLGSGGMGVVFLAEQPSLRREVALKLIRPDQLYFPNARERFRREVEVVASLQHPGIVAVHTTGEDQGIPFFAMERVHGVSLARLVTALSGRAPAALDGRVLAETLDELRREEGESSAPRTSIPAASWVATCIRWMLELAEVLDHAHRHGVLHRDIKPSNVMLTWEGRVRVLDFGLASSRSSSKLTRTGSQLGSLPYMPPELLLGGVERTDERSDVYALGVTLYELLTLQTAYQLPGESELEMRQRILAGRCKPIRELNPAVPWDAETVCFAAMEPSPERRYASAAVLAEDLRNVLELRPIAARRPSPGLRVKRWAQRHPAWAVGAVLGTLLFVVGPTAFALRERHVGKQMRRAWAAAELEADIKRATLAFLTDDLLAAVSPEEVGKDASMRAVLDAASERIEGRFPDQPLVEAALRVTIGDTYYKLGVVEPAERHLTRGLELEREHSGPESRTALAAANKLASVYRVQERHAEADELGARTLEARRRQFGDEDPDTLTSINNLGLGRVYLRRFEEAEALLMEVYAARLRLRGEEHRETLTTMNNLGVLYKDWGRYGEALDWHRRELDACTRLLGPEHPDTLVSRMNTANVLLTLGQTREALELIREVLETSVRVLGLEHPSTVDRLFGLTNQLLSLKQLDEAEQVLARLELATRALDPRHPQAIEARCMRANLERYRGHFDQALELAAAVLDDARITFGPEHPRAIMVQLLYGNLLKDSGDLEGSIAALAEATELAEESADIDVLTDALLVYGSVLRLLERYDEAEPVLTRAWELLIESTPTNVYTLEAALELTRLYDATGDQEALATRRTRATDLRARRAELNAPVTKE